MISNFQYCHAMKWRLRGTNVFALNNRSSFTNLKARWDMNDRINIKTEIQFLLGVRIIRSITHFTPISGCEEDGKSLGFTFHLETKQQSITNWGYAKKSCSCSSNTWHGNYWNHDNVSSRAVSKTRIWSTEGHSPSRQSRSSPGDFFLTILQIEIYLF